MHLLRLMTHIEQIRGIFDVANSQRYCTGFAPMLFQWSHAHIAHFFVAKNRAIKRGLEQKNRVIKKSRYVCHGTYEYIHYWGAPSLEQSVASGISYNPSWGFLPLDKASILRFANPQIHYKQTTTPSLWHLSRILHARPFEVMQWVSPSFS